LSEISEQCSPVSYTVDNALDTGDIAFADERLGDEDSKFESVVRHRKAIDRWRMVWLLSDARRISRGSYAVS
jgi:hypothetical protein